MKLVGTVLYYKTPGMENKIITLPKSVPGELYMQQHNI